jgi:hypothetical protein
MKRFKSFFVLINSILAKNPLVFLKGKNPKLEDNTYQEFIFILQITKYRLRIT